MASPAVRLGLRENLPVLAARSRNVRRRDGRLERSTLPLIGETDFGLTSSAAVLSFIVAFGLAKSFTNLAAGVGAERGWPPAADSRLGGCLPVPLLIAVAPSWAWIVAVPCSASIRDLPGR